MNHSPIACVPYSVKDWRSWLILSLTRVCMISENSRRPFFSNCSSELKYTNYLGRV